MHFDHQAIGTDGNTGSGQRRNHVIFPSSVRGSNDNGQVRDPAHGGDGGEIEGITRVLSEGTDTTFAQNDLVVSFSHNVFRRQKPFFQGGGHAAFEQNWQLGTADPAQKRVVLHVARADLDHVRVFFDQVDSWFVQSFANDFQIKFLPNLHQNFQSLLAQTSKGVR